MSYILDALRRADADRQRGGVPDLHAQPAAPAAQRGGLPADAPGAAGRLGWRLLVAAGLVLALALAAAWWLGRGTAAGGAAPAVPVAAPAAVPALAPPAAPRAAAGAERVADLSPTLVPAPAVSLATAVAAVPTTAAPTTAAAGAALAAPPAASDSAPPPGAARPGAQAAGALPAAAASDAPLRWAALPEALRSSLPALAWSGVVYAEQPSQRLLVVNGQVAREGDELAPGLRLEQIRPRSAVLRWRGQRFEMPL